MVNCNRGDGGYELLIAPQPAFGLRTSIATVSDGHRDTYCYGTYPIKLPHGGVKMKRMYEVINIHVTDRIGRVYPVYRIAGFKELFQDKTIFRRPVVNIVREDHQREDVCDDPGLP